MENRRSSIVTLIALTGGLMVGGCGRNLWREYSEINPPDKQSIRYAAMQGNLPKVKSMWAENPEPTNPVYIDPRRPLLNWAVYGGSKEVTEYLIAEGMNVNTMDGRCWRPLHIAVLRGHRDVAEVLIAHGANVNQFAQAGNPLYYAVREGHEDIAMLLLENGADVDARDDVFGYDGKRTLTSALHYAVMANEKRIAEFLISNGADVNIRDAGGSTPLHLVARMGNGRKGIAKLLIANSADVNAKDKNGQTPLSHAIWQGHDDVAGLLRKHGAVE